MSDNTPGPLAAAEDEDICPHGWPPNYPDCCYPVADKGGAPSSGVGTPPAHTPGPWHFLSGSQNFEGAGDGMLYTVGTPYGHGPMHVADVMVRGWGHLTGTGACNKDAREAAEIQNANARLIAAAPDLLEALKEILEACCSGMGTLPAADVARGEAAIAKAEGKK